MNQSEYRQPVRKSFGPFVLDLGRKALFRDALDLGLRPKTFEVLGYLAERPGQLVEKAELMSAVWGRAVVTEDSLTQCVVEIRKAFGKEHRHLIRTVPRRGYVLETGVELLDPHSSTGRASSRIGSRSRPSILTLLLAAAFLAALARNDTHERPDTQVREVTDARPKVAVLPFVDMSRDLDRAWLGDGIAEEILNRLAQSPDLVVIARTSSFTMRDVSMDVPTMAQRLGGVTHILEGSVRDDEQDLRITAQLIDTATNAHLWSETFDIDLGGTLETQELIANTVADRLHARLTTAENTPIATTANAKAWAAALQGRYFYARRDAGDLQKALVHYSRAVALDPHLALAWAGLSATEGLLAFKAEDPLPGMLRSRQAADRAYEIAPTNPEVLFRNARVYWHLGDEDKAIGFMSLAYELGEHDPLILGAQAGSAQQRGRFEESIELHELALQLDPLNLGYMHNQAQALLSTMQFDRAAERIGHGLDIYPESANMVMLLARARLGQGRATEALELFATLEPGPQVWIGEALAYQAQGNPARVRDRLERVEQLGGAAAEMYLAQFLAMTGNPRDALHKMQHSFQGAQSATGYIDLVPWEDLFHSEWLVPVRELPEWPDWSNEVRGWLTRPGIAQG